MRTIFKTREFLEFLNNSETNVKDKIDYLLEIIITQPVINIKIAKKLINTDFYEVRIQVNNEYRIIVFTIDHDNISQSRNIIFLNGFMKKSTKDYDKQIKTAIKILEKWQDQNLI
ncbi:type II toxin-antitoxin system RelE/ParE family toxin [Flavobacterium sp. M31R6]|uniref:type II toxin-antitoxin system RelE/ParE family toxin n=1 Tax=Flavobacterium sp. M31R6 TaxID=2739062 RepID=UPI0015683FE6|nr:type II toxin-antitoxin system RelE/ParE family toxin [Flavobacterium sp. M31R6]QKJ62186.1 type II toxin-antitoxin system RelE/ParE family toxin [Flavobacterium sp. M31R6]